MCNSISYSASIIQIEIKTEQSQKRNSESHYEYLNWKKLDIVGAFQVISWLYVDFLWLQWYGTEGKGMKNCHWDIGLVKKKGQKLLLKIEKVWLHGQAKEWN